MTRIYRYVLAHDGGMAPTPRGRLITLATCKPEVRKNRSGGRLGYRQFPGTKQRSGGLGGQNRAVSAS